MDWKHLLDDPTGCQLRDCWGTRMGDLGPSASSWPGHTSLAGTQATTFCLLLNLQRLFPGEGFWVGGISGSPSEFGRCRHRHRWERVQES